MKLINENTKSYFKSENKVSHWWNPSKGMYRFHYEKELQVLDDQFEVNPNWKVLDVCTGKGRFASYFAEKGCNVTAIDINEEMLSLAQINAHENGFSDKITFILGDAEDLSNIDEGYDVVCCMEALDHIPDSEKAIKEMSGKLKQGGYFLYTFVPDHSIYWKLHQKTTLKKLDDLDIATAYSCNRIQDKFKRNGVSLIKKFGVGLLFPAGPLILRIPLHILARLEKLIKPYYKSPAYVEHSTHIIGWGIKE